MTINEARVIVYDEFRDAWALGDERTIPFFFDNMAYDTNGVDEFVELKMLHVPGEHHSLGQPGNRIFRREGVIRVEISTQTSKGLKRADELGAECLRILEGQSFVSSGNTVRTTDGYFRELGPSGSHYKSEVVVNFNYQDQK